MKLKKSYLTTIYKGIVRGKSYRDIHKAIMKETVNSEVVDQDLLRSALVIAKKCDRDARREENIDFIPILIFRNIKNEKIQNKLNSDIYDKGREIESKLKNDLIEETISKSIEDKEVFMLLSKHDDSATDHKDFQGKMYIMKNWRSIINDNTTELEVERYVKKHNVKTFEWVIDNPVYMITRPNCRHYFKKLGVKEVLENSVESLLKKYGMIHKIGPRKYMQTITINSPEKVAKYRNIETLIRTYKERLDFYKELNSIKSNEEIKNAIVKTRFLIKKWEDYKKVNF